MNERQALHLIDGATLKSWIHATKQARKTKEQGSDLFNRGMSRLRQATRQQGAVAPDIR